MKSYTKTISIPMYGCKLYLVITDDIVKSVKKIFKDRKTDCDFEGEAEGVMFRFGIDSYYIVIDVKCLSNNTIAHETYHAVHRITEDRCITDEESQAWLMGFITDSMYQFAGSKNIEIKRNYK